LLIERHFIGFALGVLRGISFKNKKAEPFLTLPFIVEINF
jgi:hypothetical protein